MAVWRSYKDVTWMPEGWISYRYWCECSDPLHSLEITLDPEEDTIELAFTIGYKKTFWERVKLAWTLLREGEAQTKDIWLCKKDRMELSKVIALEKCPVLAESNELPNSLS